MSGLDWPGLMRTGLHRLGLTPDRFWRLTPAELAMMLGAPPGLQRLSRARLDELVRQWPDNPHPGHEDCSGVAHSERQ